MTEECVTRVREITRGFQEVYRREQGLEEACQVHMMDYPITVTQEGAVWDHPDWQTFPDQGGRVEGKKTMRLPPYLTT